jgi:hypothetical protein
MSLDVNANGHCCSSCSYYFQEDSSDDSMPLPSNVAMEPQNHSIESQEEILTNTEEQDPEQHQNYDKDQDQNGETSSPRSTSSRSISPGDAHTSPPLHHSRSSSPASKSSTDMKGSPDLQASHSIASDLEPLDRDHVMEDAKSLAVVIEDQFLLARSDLEESLLKNLYGSVKSIESTVGRVVSVEMRFFLWSSLKALQQLFYAQ